MARKRLVPSPGFGQSLYDCIKSQRRADGSTWEAEDLSARLGREGVQISAKQLRDWIKHGNRRLAVVATIAQLFGTTMDEMWKGHCKPINLPQDARPPRERPTPPAANGERRERQRVAAEKAAKAAQRDSPVRKSRRHSG